MSGKANHRKHKDGTNVRSILNREAQDEIDELEVTEEESAAFQTFIDTVGVERAEHIFNQVRV